MKSNYVKHKLHRCCMQWYISVAYICFYQLTTNIAVCFSTLLHLSPSCINLFPLVKGDRICCLSLVSLPVLKF